MKNIIAFGEVLMDCLPDKNVIGGAPFNVAIHLKRFGNQVTFISKIAKDDFGNEIFDFAKNENIEQGISFDKNHPTGFVSVKFIENEPHYTIETEKAWQYIEYVAIDKPVDVFIYGSLALYFEKNQTTFLQYKTENPSAIFVCDLNLRGDFYSETTINFCLSNTTILKVNDDEWMYLKEIFKQSTDDQLLDYLKNSFSIIKIIRTQSKKGALVYWDNTIIQESTQMVSDNLFKDAIGAGDGFLACFLNSYFKENDVQKALKNSLIFAAKICQFSGAIPSNKTIYQ
ncbi:fructokinase [Flavobacterium sp. CG_23.5]|uniref:PfkB family carbohydrate kinase n=1 Tax=unclassified Flavobacterium TaxID=196869 RepID=UPI0018CB4BB6|nr:MULTISPECIES: PfkB family carbohydrate kinase [unclassified Flavobacterium]MBG6111527.1 fructokinase [Flavobacterium sp. CG_9.10]MBP2282622.1 fructokinase [Flavobacterium sp. CG_23.5]